MPFAARPTCLFPPLLRGAAVALLAAGLAGPASAAQYVGLVYPSHDINLSMGIGGVVARLTVKPGQSVKAGEVLLVLDDRMQTIEVNRRQVVFEDNGELQAAGERARALYGMLVSTRRVYQSTGSISRDEMRKLDVENAAARGRYEQLQAQKRREKLEYEGAVQERALRAMKAPRAGVITQVEPKVGEWARPGEPLIRLVDAATCYLSTNVPLAAVAGLKPGQALTVRFETDAGAPPVTGKVGFVSSVADAASGLVEVRIELPNPGMRIRPGIKGMVDLPAAK
jgi:RND family efflux transporter MFP subunit